MGIELEFESLDDVVLLDRVRKLIDQSPSNLLLYGPFGMGKSTVSKILIKGHPTFYRNASKERKIDMLREDMTSFTRSMTNDPFGEFSSNQKIIYLEEFEKLTPLVQDALKAFIDEENKHGTRFIFTTNYKSKVDGGIISRCTEVNFAPQNAEESKELKIKIAKYLYNIIEDKEFIKEIISSKFPDIRKMVELCHLKVNGAYSDIEKTQKGLVDTLYFMISSGENIKGIQDWLVRDVSESSIDELLNECGRPLIERLAKSERHLLEGDKLGKIYSIVAEHSYWLSTIRGGDPYVVALSCINKIKEYINNV